MSFVVCASAHGSPGVSTAVQLAAAQWGQSQTVPVVVEADATGGVLAARYEIALTPGFVSLAESLRKVESPPLLSHAQRLPSGVACVPLAPSATAAGAQLRSAGPHLGRYLAASGHPVLLDAGTVLPDSKVVPAMTAADLVLWFVRPTREELLVLRHRLAECPQPDQVGVVLVGQTPYNAEQVSEALEVDVVHTLPIDSRAATAANLGGDDRYLRRSQLARSCSQLAIECVERTAAAVERRKRAAGAGSTVPTLPTSAPPAAAPPPAPAPAPPPAAPAPASAPAPPLAAASAPAAPPPPAPVSPAPSATDDPQPEEDLLVWQTTGEPAAPDAPVAPSAPLAPSPEDGADPGLVVWVNDPTT